MLSFNLEISHAQIALFNSDLINPFNQWSDINFKQGFSWRRGSVSFKTLAIDGTMRVEYKCMDKYVPAAGARRAISVPFECDSTGKIEIASIWDAQHILMSPGLYQIIFETGENDGQWCRITCIKDGDLTPRIIIQDSDIDPIYPLDMGDQGSI